MSLSREYRRVVMAADARRVGLVGAIALVGAAAAAWLSPSRPVAAGPLDQRIERSIDVSGVACIEVAAHLSLEAPMELAVQRADIRPAPCPR